MTFRGRIAAKAFIIYEEPILASPNAYFSGRSRIGAYTYFGDYCQIGSCTIGRFCSIASHVSIGLGEHPVDTLSTHPFFFGSANGFPDYPPGIGSIRDLSSPKFQTPVIGNDVWIGANAIISRGVTIGNGAVIAAGAVVVTNVPDYTIVGGVPARLIRERFDRATVDQLQQTKWWDLPLAYFIGKDVKAVKELAESIIHDRNEGIVQNAEYPSNRLTGAG